MSEFSLSALHFALPELFLAVAGMGLLMIGVVRGNEGTRMLCRTAAGIFGVAALFLLGVDWNRHELFNGFFYIDKFSAYIKFLVLIGMAASALMATRYLQQEQMARFEYPVLLVFAGLGMLMMISAGNMLSLYMGMELQSLSLYVLAAIRRDFIKSSEAGLKYFVLGALASGMMLFGISLVYGHTGSLSFMGIESALGSGSIASGVGLTVGMVFIFVGLAFKVSAVPFHMWTPDVYEGAPTSVTALFAIVPKIAAMAVMMRLAFDPFSHIMPQWQQIVWFLAAASMIVGAFAAIVQTNIKRLIAYSAIGNMGYALIGLASGTVEGAGAVIIYMTIYMVMSIGVFVIILSMRRNGIAVEAIDELAGLSRNHPLMAWTMAFLMFSMSGIPPLAGFFGKLFIFKAAMAAGMYYLAVIGVLSSVVASYYYLRIIKVMFFDEPVDSFDRSVGTSLRVLGVLSVIFVLGFVLTPGALVNSSREAAAVLFAE